MRIALGIEYDGSCFNGWQIQKHAGSVQACVQQALSQVADHAVSVVCAGRTDAGVHAAGQVVHFDTQASRATRSWVLGTNANLPKSISVLWATSVDDMFHARFSAIRRHYRFVIFNRPVRPSFLAKRVTWEFRPLDVPIMQRAASPLLGEHDFSAFRALACQAKSPIRTLYRLDIQRQGELLFFDMEANAFLHHMVRNIVGVLLAVGTRKRPPEWVEEVLKSRDRTQGGITALPYGLYLMKVYYPPEYSLPQLSCAPAVW